MRLFALLFAASALAAPNTPPSLSALDWEDCIEIDCYVSATYPVPTYNTVYLGTLIHRGPAPMTTSDACVAQFGASQPPGTPIHGMVMQVFATEADSGVCMDPPPADIPDPIDPPGPDLDQWLHDLEERMNPQEPVSFDPPDGVEWP